MNASDEPLDQVAIATWLRSEIARLLEIPPDSIDTAESFESYGMASSDALFLSGDLSEYLGVELSATLAWDHPTIDELSELLARVVRGEIEVPKDSPDWDLGSELFGTA